MNRHRAKPRKQKIILERIKMAESAYNELLGHILRVELTNGRTFCSKLYKIENATELWFVSKKGITYMNRSTDISRVVVIA